MPRGHEQHRSPLTAYQALHQGSAQAAAAPWLIQLKRDVAGLPYDRQLAQLTPSKGQAALAGASRTETSAAAVQMEEAEISAGMFGMVTRDLAMKDKDGSTVDLKAGEAVEIVSAGKTELTVKVWSGHGGIQGKIPTDAFKEQPRISDNEDTKKPENYVYKQFSGKLFLGKKSARSGKRYGKQAPRLEDVLQGSLGDCYLLASLGAVVAARPDIIQDMITYDSGSKLFTVTFQELQDDGSFKPHVEVVDSYLPSSITSKYPKYAGNDGKEWDPKDMVLWPAIIEKAYAQWQGGYKALEEHGGLAEEVMMALTGGESGSIEIPSDEKELINLLKEIQKDQKPACAGSRNYMREANKEGLFAGGGSGPYTATLITAEGLPAELVKGKVSVADQGGKAGTAKDDKNGNMKGSTVQDGTVSYEGGAVSITYKNGKNPKAPADLKATYNYHGLLSKALNIYGEHYYIFRGVKSGKIILHNPWGPDPSYQPKPMTAAEFLMYFDALDVNTPPPAEAVR
ncbi:MAG: hypothetical protein JW797_10250 [Bradymonadales bacterium]|nr:hypothetical protein [Bradymonadales bacterium]